jgi:hypothetical protein
MMLLYLILACGDKLDNGDEIIAYEGDDAGECSDGADNDKDELFDCDDDGCFGSPDCPEPDDEPVDTGDPADTGDTSDTSDTDSGDSGDSGDTDAPPECNPGSGELIAAGDLPVQITGSLIDDPIYDLAGWSLAICDLDNDGYDDLAVGVPYAAGGAGRVALFYGPGDTWNSFMDTTGSNADAYIFADGSAGYLGETMACGDVNGDGADDLVMGVGQGEVYGLGVNAGVRVFYNTGAKLSGQVPVNNADVSLFHDTGYTGTIAHFTSLWTSDVDGDGMEEVLFFMNRNSYYGDVANNTDNKLWVLNVDGNESGAMADVVSHKITPDNLDGVTTVSEYSSGIFVGQGFHHADGGIPGIANFVSGTITSDMTLSSGSTAILNGSASTGFGTSAVFADFNNDGTDETVIGAPGDGGEIHIYDSDPSSFTGDSSGASRADRSFTTNFNHEGLGWRMKAIGDINGDGHPELLVSALGENNFGVGAGSDTGKVFVVDGLCLDGTTSNINAASLLQITGEGAGDRFGWEVEAGDINGDGKPDIAIAAPYYETASAIYNGKVYVWLSE